MMDSTTATTYEGRHRPTGVDYLSRLSKFLELEAAAKRGRYHYFPRHSAAHREVS